MILKVVTHSKKCSVFFVDKDSAEVSRKAARADSKWLQLMFGRETSIFFQLLSCEEKGIPWLNR